MRPHRFVAVVGSLLLIAAATAPVAGTGAVDTDAGDRTLTTQGATTAQQVAGSETIDLTQTVRRLPDRPGSYEAHHEYRVPDGVGILEVTLPERATVTAQQGFVRQEDGRYAWNGRTATPTLTYRVAANRTTDREGPIAGPGDYLFVDTGEWGLVSLPEAAHRWGWETGGTVGFDTETTVSGPGAAGERIAFLGAHERYTHAAHDQQFTLIVPERATLEDSPSELFASLSDASDRLRVGDRDERVFLVAAPTGQVEWGVRGLQTGASDVWTRDAEPLNSSDNVWLHEYVHTRQDYASASDLQWFTEGSADYYAALLTLEQGRIDFEQFHQTVGAGTDRRFDGAVLADPATWANHANYHVGALVAGELDRRLRVATNGSRSLQTVLWRLNGDSGPVSATTFATAIDETGDESVGRAAERYTETPERPAMWGPDQHTAAFRSDPARITYRLADEVRVTGPYRNRTVDAAGGLVLVPGERVTLDATATNDGGTAGAYEAALTADGRRESVATGSLDPGESATVALSGTSQRLGTSRWTVGNAALSVDTREPATARVTDLTADRTQVRSGESVTLTVTARNDAAYPGQRTVSVGDSELTIRVDADATATATVQQRFDDPGRYTISVDGTTETITVRESAGNLGRVETALLLGVLAVVTLAGAGLIRRSR